MYKGGFPSLTLVDARKRGERLTRSQKCLANRLSNGGKIGNVHGKLEVLTERSGKWTFVDVIIYVLWVGPTWPRLF